MSHVQVCPVCESDAITPFLRRAGVPVHQNLVMEDQASARNITRGDLELAVCDQCGFGFNRTFDLSKLSYGDHYDNTQICSPSFNDHVTRLVRYLVVDRNVQNCRVIEVGCGAGLFLKALVEFEGSGNTGIGFDPAYTGPTDLLDGRLTFQKQYYGPECADASADIVICRHVIEHVPNPVVLLKTIREALIHSPRARVFFETPCLKWILRNETIWDLFYEHCSYFSLNSLTSAFEVAGFMVETRRHVFGGQYLWIEATLAPNASVVRMEPGNVPSLARQFTTLEETLKRDWEAKIQDLAKKGNFALWGAGAKGVTLANLVDPQYQWIDCIVDLNPRKQGHYLPGTGHPIVAYQELPHRHVKTAVVMNPNYYDEIQELIDQARLHVSLTQ